ncbi:MBL fold metallo-hydrolase [Streptomyces sp. ODS28]|uniref:MBL fold metallo-hydrolase n=1 Tax=Streptomyces sp. ODS28 TaxID=3136688 RepID=UPI0031E621CF
MTSEQGFAQGQSGAAGRLGDTPETRLPGAWTRTLGELTLSYLPDSGIAMLPERVYPGTGPEDWEPHRRHLTEAGHLAMGCGALLVERGSTRLLIDAGHGSVSGEEPAPFQHSYAHVRHLPAALEKLGVDPAEVDAVAFTHLHPDHSGWARPDATEGEDSLFPNARWLLGEGEPPEPLAGGKERVTCVPDGAEIADGVRAWALSGHTPGHTAWILDTGDGRSVVAFGDAMHSPVQVRHPDWEVLLDGDREAAERSRRRLVEHLSGEGVLGFGVHFADQQVGTVENGRWRGIDA